MSATLELAQDLIRRPSVTPEDAGCQALMISRLQALGFTIEHLPFGEVSNFWARRGDAAPLIVFAGHTDVVPTGPLDDWTYDPFEPTIADGYLYGRGAADMKSSLAAMITACDQFLAQYPDPQGSIGFLITSDEEGPAVDGTVRVVEHLQVRGEKIDACLVGEPSSSEHLGDIIKNGRRGSLNGRLLIKGIQGHVAYPEQVRNPIHVAGPIIDALAREIWDQGNEYFPPTSFQVSNVRAGTGAENVVPGTAELVFNFRFSTESTAEGLQARVQRIVDTAIANQEIASAQVFDYELDWRLSGQPFLTEPGALVAAATQAIQDELGLETTLSTSGGTSDGRFIAPTGAQVLELGPVNATIHKLNERVLVADLDRLSRVYAGILSHYLG